MEANSCTRIITEATVLLTDGQSHCPCGRMVMVGLWPQLLTTPNTAFALDIWGHLPRPHALDVLSLLRPRSLTWGEKCGRASQSPHSSFRPHSGCPGPEFPA